jgi:hypothetical protein
MDKATFMDWIRGMSSGIICTLTGLTKYAEIDKFHTALILHAEKLQKDEITYPYRERDKLIAEVMGK